MPKLKPIDTARQLQWISFFLVVFLVFVVDALCPVSLSYDSRWTIFVVESIINRHDTNLDEYLAFMNAAQWSSIDCTDRAGHALIHQDFTDMQAVILRCTKGHIYNSYPIGVPVLATPVVLGMHAALWLGRPLLTRIPRLSVDPTVKAFVLGDFITAHVLAERIVASFFVALTAGFMFLIANLWLPEFQSVMLALLFAFPTPAWSVASRVLLQHAPSMLAITVTLYLLVSGQKKQQLIPVAGLMVACAYSLRPGNAIWVIVISSYVALFYRRQFLKYLLWSLPVAILFCAYHYQIYHSVFSSYYQELRPVLPRNKNGWLVAGTTLAGLLGSPSRGLFVFSPHFFFSLYGIYLSIRHGWQKRLSIVLMCFLLGVCTALSFQGHWLWWGGWSYGPRMLSDLTPVLTFFLIPVIHQLFIGFTTGWRSRLTQVIFLITVAVGAFIHSQGALSLATDRWNYYPSSLETRLWDWNDPQFLRGITNPPYGVYRWGKPLEFKGDGGDFTGALLESGWAEPEPGFRWTVGRRASIRFRVEASSTDKVLVANFETKILPYKSFPVVVSIDGRAIGEWNVVLEQEYRLPIPVSSLEGKKSFLLTLDMPMATTPKLLGVNEDSRVLGLAVRQLAIRDVSSGGHGS